MFKHLSVDGFRRLCGVELELRPLCVLIGANGSGKSSLLDVFSLLAASAQGKLDEKISELGGLAAILTQGRTQQMRFSLLMEMDDRAPVRYDLAITPRGTGHTIKENFALQRPRGPLGVRRLPYGASEEFRKRLASPAYYHTLNVGARSPVRLPQPMRPAKLPGPDGENLVTCLYDMRETDRDRFDTVQDGLRAAFPGFQRLDFPPVAAGTLSMVWRDDRFPEGFYPHQLSEGMLRFLWLATLLQSPGLTAITLIDEPEVSLHPELLSLLADLLREASQRSQVIVATHSDSLVRFLRPKEVVAVDVTEEGLAKMTWAEKLNLEKWLGEYNLDDVWRMGRLGARA